MTDDYTELYAKARAATEGPWGRMGSSTLSQVLIEAIAPPDGDARVHYMTSSISPEPFRVIGDLDDAEYIAAASPDVVLALIAELRRLRVKLEAWERLGSFKDMPTTPEQVADAEAILDEDEQ